jgi:hypothetical protein
LSELVWKSASVSDICLYSEASHLNFYIHCFFFFLELRILSDFNNKEMASRSFWRLGWVAFED